VPAWQSEGRGATTSSLLSSLLSYERVYCPRASARILLPRGFSGGRAGFTSEKL